MADRHRSFCFYCLLQVRDGEVAGGSADRRGELKVWHSRCWVQESSVEVGGSGGGLMVLRGSVTHGGGEGDGTVV